MRPPGKRPRLAAEATYRPCPICRKLMVRRAFAGSSGIVLDICGPHGLWFDSEELEAVLEWIRSGGLTRVEERQAAERKESARRDALEKNELRPVLAEQPPQGHWLDLLGELADLVLGGVRKVR